MPEKIEPPEPQTVEDIRTLEAIAWAPRNCEALSVKDNNVRECGKPPKYRFKTLSPYGKTTTEYACSTEHALLHAQHLWGIGNVIQ